jgi:hypothetical protein
MRRCYGDGSAHQPIRRKRTVMKDTATPSEGGSSRWWEFYAVRYAMGTVVGAVVFLLLCSSVPTLRPLLFGTGISDTTSPTDNVSLSVKPNTAKADTDKPDTTKIKLDAVQLTLLAVYGLIYCYIASAPILVLHAARFLLSLDVGAWVRVRRFLCYGLVPLILGISAYVWGASRFGLVERCFYAVIALIVGLIVWLQYVVVPLTLFRSKELYAFYERLAGNREGARGGMTDSYRHLREHGNSFFIVLLEIVLGVTLFGIGRYLVGDSSASKRMLSYIVVLLVWIIPAVFVWLIATVFERRFADAN